MKRYNPAALIQFNEGDATLLVEDCKQYGIDIVKRVVNEAHRGCLFDKVREPTISTFTNRCSEIKSSVSETKTTKEKIDAAYNIKQVASEKVNNFANEFKNAVKIMKMENEGENKNRPIRTLEKNETILYRDMVHFGVDDILALTWIKEFGKTFVLECIIEYQDLVDNQKKAFKDKLPCTMQQYLSDNLGKKKS